MKKYKIALREKLFKDTFKDKLRVGDKVIIIAGKSKGQTGTLLKKVRSVTGLRYVVQGCNLATKHEKPNPQLQQAGGIRKVEASVHSSNVAIYNADSKKADKIAIKREDGKAVRVYKSTQKEIILPVKGKKVQKSEVTQ
jgi:large subunit ribosomal protein L24